MSNLLTQPAAGDAEFRCIVSCLSEAVQYTAQCNSSTYPQVGDGGHRYVTPCGHAQEVACTAAVTIASSHKVTSCTDPGGGGEPRSRKGEEALAGDESSLYLNRSISALAAASSFSTSCEHPTSSTKVT